MKSDYEFIKDKFGERMAKMCRELFPTLFETRGLLSNFLIETFEPNATLYQDIAMGKKDTFKNFVYSHFNINNKSIDTNKSVSELLESVGYRLYKCDTYEETLNFKKYYSNGEELCTFGDPYRVKKNMVFFAVKNNATLLKRDNYKIPFREDEYGTSVISIQFSNGINNYLSIKNRYNSTVNNPGATFSNNLDNIVEGLTSAFEKEYNLNINKIDNSKLVLDDYVVINNKYYKYNYCINDIYYCPNNTIIDNGRVIKYHSSRYKLFDYFILDYRNKNISLYDKNIEDSFDIKNITKIGVDRVRNTNNIMLDISSSGYCKSIIQIDQLGRMIAFGTNKMKIIPDNFLSNNKYLRVMTLNDSEYIGNNFLNHNENLSILYGDKINYIGDGCLSTNALLENVDLNNCRHFGDEFLANNFNLKKINACNAVSFGNRCFMFTEGIKELDLPNLESVGDYFLYSNNKIDKYNFPKLKNVGIGTFGGEVGITTSMLEVINKNARRESNEENRKDEQVGGSGKLN